ncbi:MAG TPA: hypothetical protein VEZ14_06160 [Dehalococcoidia bacterium]|nr:hypothetical protein [Dehalococcoidia bacterium]
MDRLAELANDLTDTLNELRKEANRRDLRGCAAPLAWLDEANGWLRYELARAYRPDREPVPFTYIPVELRK